MWVARWHREQDKCRQCGHPRAVCSDPDVVWYANRVTCYATRARIAAEGLQHEIRKDLPFHDGTEEDWADVRSPSHPYRYDDGVTIIPMLEDLTPGDHFFTPTDQ